MSDDKPRLSSLAQSDYVVPVAPMPRFPFSAAMKNNFQNLQPIMMGRPQHFVTVPRSKEAIYNPLELPSEYFTFSKDPPVIDRGFSDVSRCHAGAAHSKKFPRSINHFTKTAVFLLLSGLVCQFCDVWR